MAYDIQKTANSTKSKFPETHAADLADRVEDGIAPAGCPIATTCLLVEKHDYVVCDGYDRWFLETLSGEGKFINAGEPWSKLYS